MGIISFHSFISDFLLITGPKQVIHVNEDNEENCHIKNTVIDDSKYYATGDVFANELVICGGATSNQGLIPSASSCTIFPANAEKSENVLVYWLTIKLSLI